MAQALDTFGILYQNLIDAGCDKETVERCMFLAKEDKKTDILRLLSGHREALLDTVHAGQKQIDCLDFLTYTLKKELKSGGQLK